MIGVAAVCAGLAVGYLIGAICSRWNEDERVETAVVAAIRERDRMYATRPPFAHRLGELGEAVTN